ncbi:MAG: response regulator [Cyanobacteria bacterium J06635_1]
MKILLVEDDDILAEVLVNALTAEHYAIDVAADGQMGWELASAFDYDLILLDVMLPKLDGISLCRKLRSHGSQTPILLLTAQDTSTSKVLGLDAGADDYMTKPFDQKELLARIRALQRREAVTLLPVLTWKSLSLDPSTREVTHHGEPIYLRPREYDLLELFLRNPHRVFSRGAILDHLWSFEGSPGEETVTAHIKGLRQHLKAAGVSQNPIETVYGIGYRLRETPKPERLSHQAAHQANTKTAAVWDRAKQRLSNRIAVIEQATSAGITDTLADELRQQAEKEAHKLAGSLGMFNFDEGSQLAREAELAFHNWPSLKSHQRSQLAELVGALRQSVQQAIQSETPTLFAPPEVPPAANLPYLLVISTDADFSDALATAATGWAMQTETDPSAVRGMLTRRRPDVVLLDLSSTAQSQQTIRLTPDTVTFLAELQAMTPPVPVLLRTDQDSLIDRVKVARLGGRGFISPALPATTVIETVMQLWVRSRPAAATVLAVDDDPHILEAMRQLLEPWGLKLFTLNDPRRFWEVLNDTQPDLLVLDVEMPYVDGLALCQVVRSDLHWSHLPILFLTAHTDAATQGRVFEVGADDYVAKPIVGPALVTRILNRLERSRLGQVHTEIDALSGVANRRHAAQAVAQLLTLARQHHQPLCLAALKIDRLETLNREYGYDIGNAAITQLGQLLRRAFAGEDVVGRWGGRLFVVAMYGMTAQDGIRRLKALLQDFRKIALPIEHPEKVALSFSAGVITYPIAADDCPPEKSPEKAPEKVIERAIERATGGATEEATAGAKKGTTGNGLPRLFEGAMTLLGRARPGQLLST